MMQLSLVLLIIVYYLNINLKAQLGFIDFTSFLETSDKLNDVLLKIKQKFKNQYPYTKVDQDLQNIVEQFANKFKISWNDLNSINQILIVELIEGLKKKAYTNHLILDAAVMLKELQQEKNKLIKFKNENQDKNVDESNIEQIISITMPHLQQLLELNANIKGIRDTLRFLQHNFSKGRSGYIELVLFTKNLAEEEFEAQLLFIKCINQLQ
ncbi:unnamed protein product [Paramecium sonneborni]|uniref:SB domain-containing protein n=1 Tax=Paramecium sonneborni TaxID=65129 RepID=A0A8S1KHU8_9CILI|nr:unnamed protein product [Paramecium sonneborni]